MLTRRGATRRQPGARCAAYRGFRPPEKTMLRKLILLALASGLAKKLYDEWRASHLRTPFPTSSRPPEGYKS